MLGRFEWLRSTSLFPVCPSQTTNPNRKGHTGKGEMGCHGFEYRQIRQTSWILMLDTMLITIISINFNAKHIHQSPVNLASCSTNTSSRCRTYTSVLRLKKCKMCYINLQHARKKPDYYYPHPFSIYSSSISTKISNNLSSFQV
jgi:hypothetical protein